MSQDNPEVQQKDYTTIKYAKGDVLKCPRCTNTQAYISQATENVAVVECTMCDRSSVIKNEVRVIKDWHDHY